MTNIATLTLNPTIDVACSVERLDHTSKMRGADERTDPGGGGINVARAIVRLGDNARVYYLSGGAIGITLDSLLDLHQLVRARIPIAGSTRVSTTVLERATGNEFRVVPAGPLVAESEWKTCLAYLAEAKCDYLVASGSLPRGVPEDFYSRVCAIAQDRRIRFVLDSSGGALKSAINTGGVFLAKPNLAEFCDLIGTDLTDVAAIADAAMEIIERGRAEHLVVSMGNAGALLANASGPLHLPAMPVETSSTVGAGDSFVAAMVHAFALGWEPADAFRFGMAAGAAAVLTPGTDLCRRVDVYELYEGTAAGLSAGP